jgi:predicted cobalt transporter CbtA
VSAAARRGRVGIRQAALGGVVIALQPALAAACPMCFSAASPRVLETYYFTAVLLSLLPLVILGTFATWLYRRLR